MKKILTLTLIVALLSVATKSSQAITLPEKCLGSFNLKTVPDDIYETQVVFPANYQVGDYIEFLRVYPIDAGTSGNYEVSISYVRGNMAASATHLASISHANPALWREVGKTNNNDYVGVGFNFTVDCNTEYGIPRFRIRAVNTYGVKEDLVVHVKVRSINYNSGWAPLNNTGNDLTVNKFLSMTNDWSLYVGPNYTTEGAKLALKATNEGNIGIGTADPKGYKLAVNGKVRAQEIKVETANWPDYVFAKDYQLPSLKETEKHIQEKGHLPGIPSAVDVKDNGVDLGEMNARLLQKIEELTLHLIEKDKQIIKQQEQIELIRNDVQVLKIKLDNAKLNSKP
ncbi:hypothetical protein [Pedobacter nutrimenti]|uniref:Uncharacterized protein n=1 Tax=Pedobacter nutrimenti TaxID=1241337 RepID=A0A318UFD4_9SPHI|nr:hypothetical protein [Pedobacter nutrimenti]PYF74190.1 hypothetical protein B0O44_104361 [Pedobacter nutrimenti]